MSHLPITGEGISPFAVSQIAIPGEDVHSIVIHPHRECTTSPGMGMCLTGNAPPHPECISSPGMHMFAQGGLSVNIHLAINFRNTTQTVQESNGSRKKPRS